jgi:ATP-dependent Lon protease
MCWHLQIYRKSALRIVQELGEEVFPEPEPIVVASVNSQDPPSNESSSSSASNTFSTSSESSSSSSTELLSEEKVETTVERKPLVVPDTVHVRITPETLKDYVGPPAYQKDRMYTNPPPAGVSTGLGYLGNGSESVMAVEVMVSPSHVPLHDAHSP